MEDYNKFNNNSGSSNEPQPDYYQPHSGDANGSSNGDTKGSYYTEPAQEENNTTYHYSYAQSNQQQSTQGGPWQSSQNNAYQYQPNSSYEYSSTPNDANTANMAKPPKKSKAAKIIIAVLVVCLVAAVVGMVISITSSSDADAKDSTTTTQSQSADDAAKTQASGEVALTDANNNYTVAGVADKVLDSCVGITVYSQQSDAYNYFYGYGQGDSSQSEPSQSGEGSGVLMAEQDGKTYVLTCAHVISDGDSFTVTLNDGTEVEAQMVGFDSQTDIGVLSINKTGLKIAEFADSDNLVVGEQVVAIGCPGGLEFMNSLTSGHISALARPISSSIGYDTECIQIDAAINPGNSGGALFNMQGQVIGINSSKIAATEYEGMGFAVPSSTAIATANSLIKVGYVEGRAKLGITYNQLTNFNNAEAVIQALAQQGFEDAQGVMVIDSVDEESDLADKDIRQYDMIVAVNGKTMTSTDVMTSTLSDSKPGDTIKLTIARIENNSIKTFEVECTLIESKG